MNDPNSNQNEINHEIKSNDIRNSQIDASTSLEETFEDVNCSVSEFARKIEARNMKIGKVKTGIKFENGNSSDRFYQFIERLLILLGFTPTVYFLNYDWLKN